MIVMKVKDLYSYKGNAMLTVQTQGR